MWQAKARALNMPLSAKGHAIGQHDLGIELSHAAGAVASSAQGTADVGCGAQCRQDILLMPLNTLKALTLDMVCFEVRARR